MRVFVAGATGVIGTELVPRLVAAGHEVTGTTRSESKQAMLNELGAAPEVADALDPDQVAEAVAGAKPDVIVHQLIAIPKALDMRHFDRDFALTNRLRTEGTDYLLSAGQAVGVRRFVAQGVGAYGMYGRTGGPVKSEEDPLESTPVRDMRETLAAIRCGPSSTSPTRRRRRSRRSSTAAEVSDLAVGAGMLTFTLAPFALPFVALVALAAVALLIPALGVALLFTPFLVARRYWRSRDRSPVARRFARPGEGEVGHAPVRHELLVSGGPAA